MLQPPTYHILLYLYLPYISTLQLPYYYTTTSYSHTLLYTFNSYTIYLTATTSYLPYITVLLPYLPYITVLQPPTHHILLYSYLLPTIYK